MTTSCPSRSSGPTLLVYALGVVAVALTVMLASFAGRPPDQFTRDPLAIMQAPFYIGLLSNINAATWFAAAGACWSMAVVLMAGGPMRRSAAMAAAAMVITLLAMDDLFMLHEDAFPRYLGIPEKATLLAHALLIGGVAMMFRNEFRTTPWRLLIPAAIMFVGSIAVDQFSVGWGWRPVIEDSLKFMGVAGVLAWTLACARTWLMPRT